MSRLLSAFAAFVLLLSVPAFAADQAPIKVGQDANKPPEKVQSRLLSDAPLEGDYVLGKKEAPVTVIEYASLSCPHCAAFHKDALPAIQKNYIDTGKVRYILRQFPLNEPALKAAMLVDCMGEEGGVDRYYTFSKVLFDAQNQWAFDANFLQSLETFASVGGVSKDKFGACINDTQRELKVLKVKKLANDELKIPGTPHFFVNGYRYEGDRSAEAMSKFIDEQLKKK